MVEASAGSGKTYQLTKRYLKLLFLTESQNPFEGILAITFANKATLEMKERILEFLKRLALDSFENPSQKEELCSFLGLEEKVLSKKAYSLMDKIIRHYNFFQVQTIDSFINTLLYSSPLSIERSATFRVKKEHLSYLAYCLDLVMEEAQKDKELFKILEEFLGHYLFVENRISWFPKKDILKLMASFFSLLNRYAMDFFVPSGELNQLLQLKRSLYGLICKVVDRLPEGINLKRARSLLNFVQENRPLFETSKIPQVLSLESPPLNKAKGVPRDFLKMWKGIHQGLKRMMEWEALLVYKPYIKIFKYILKNLEKLCRQEDILFLEELNQKARFVSGEKGLSVAEVYYRLATRFKHYLIDEFQDTSLLQWKNLLRLVEEALSSGGSLFYVGDKKQAIYRFRGGEVQLFEEVGETFKHFNLRLETLTQNRRSQKVIVEFNNRIFSEENLRRFLSCPEIIEELGDEERGEEVLEVFRHSRQEYDKEKPGGYVRVEYIEEKNKLERNEIIRQKVLALVKQLRERFSYPEIAILSRDNSDVELLTHWLVSAGIPVESEKTLNALENPRIKEIISFLKFLAMPMEDLSFASFILGEIFLRASALSFKEVNDFIFELHREELLAGGTPLYRFFQQIYPNLWRDYFLDFFKNVGFISLYELVVGIYERFAVYDKFPNQQAFFMKFLELIKESEEEHPTLGDFLEYLEEVSPEELYVNASREESLKVLTIHKAKGLEFGVVILPFLALEIRPDHLELGSSYLERNNKIKLLRINKIQRLYSRSLQEVYRKAYLDALIDELNVLYVALTRPCYELYLFLPARVSYRKNKARFLIALEEAVVEYGKPQDYLRKEEALSLVEVPASKYKDWFKLLREEFLEEEHLRNRQRIQEGNILHVLLSQIGNCSAQAIPKLLGNAERFLGYKFLFLKDVSFYIKKIERLLEEKDLEDIFYLGKAEVFCEKEIVSQQGELKRIDRLIIKEGEVWVIDYKTTTEGRETAILQVREYVGILKEIYPDFLIRGFLVYIEEAYKEEV